MDFEEFNIEPLDHEQMRLESEIIKMRLEVEFGARFPPARMPDDDPEDEYVFLKRVLQLHQRIANTPPRPLRDMLNFGQFPLASVIEDEVELTKALHDILEYLETYNVIVDFELDYPDRVMYEFITTELPALEVIGAPADDEYICVLYESFHPNTSLEVEVFCLEFFDAIIGGEMREAFRLFFNEQIDQPKLCGRPQSEIVELSDRFLEYFPKICSWALRFGEDSDQIVDGDWTFAEGSGVASGRILYDICHDGNKTENLSGPWQCTIHRLEGRWWMGDFDFYGFSWGAEI